MEAVGWVAHSPAASVGGKSVAVEQTKLGYAVSFDDTGKAETVVLR